ncbi:MAG: MBL fold metallo-hydrolase [Patescibacteria group bacterium]
MLNDIFLKLTPHSKRLLLLFAALVVLDAVLWGGILFPGAQNLKIHFLSVGQGDGELVVFPGGAKLLIDGGPPNGRVLEEVGTLLGPTDRTIDLVLLSHPQLDHFGGLIEVVKRYRVGALLWNGEEGVAGGFQDLLRVLRERQTPVYVLGRGDAIRYKESRGEIVWPPANYRGKDPNDNVLVLALKSAGSETLFTGDLGREAEQKFLTMFHDRIDLLKVGHHGSKFATSKEFLNVLKPKVAVIEVGKNNYGHPTQETLGRLKDIGARIFRTDHDGTVTVEVGDGKLKLFTHSR